jgi:hypothetical protein
MIVTTGKIIKVELSQYRFECSSETPGLVTVIARDGARMSLPCNERDAQDFVRAYLRTVQEDLGYRTKEVE